MTINFKSSYTSTGKWLKGNLHTHTTRSDGYASPQETIACYAAADYDFLMLSDHDKLSNYDEIDSCGMTLLPGNEITARGPHMLHVGATTKIDPAQDRQTVLDNIQSDTGFAVCNHPNWQTHYNHFPQELLESLNGYAGIEIVNGVCERLEGTHTAFDRWDMLLSKGRNVWGYANDDSHAPVDLGLAWNMVQSENTVDAIVTALQTGNFYASTGVVITDIRVFGDCIGINSENAKHYTVSTINGIQVFNCDGPNLFFRPTDEMIKKIQKSPSPYFRITAHGNPGEFAYLQPFYVECPETDNMPVPTYSVKKIADSSTDILSKDQWENISKLQRFVDSELGKITAFSPEVKIVADSKSLFMTIKCLEPLQEYMTVDKRKNDDPGLWLDDSIEIFIAPANSKDYCQIIINADGYHVALSKNNRVLLHDDKITTKATRDDYFWTLDIRIPLSIISETHCTEFIFNMNRNKQTPDKGASQWSYTMGDNHIVERFGKIVIE